MLRLGVPLETVGPSVAFNGSEWAGAWDGFTTDVPGDFSSAAFILAAAALVPESRVAIAAVGTNPTRSGFVDVLRHMGIGLDCTPRGETQTGEPLAHLGMAYAAQRRGALCSGEVLLRAIDEVPVLCAMAAATEGLTKIRDAKELRVKESDRLQAMAGVVRAFGADCEELPDGLSITGCVEPRAAEVESEGDHRVAMAASVLALVARGTSVVRGVECAEVSFPGFFDLLSDLGADIRLIE